MATNCPVTKLWQGIYSRSDKTMADELIDHAQTCPTCKAEVFRLNAENEKKQGSPIAEFLSDFATGCGVLAVFGAFMALRGITRNFENAVHKIGGETPPWFKPFDEDKK